MAFLEKSVSGRGGQNDDHHLLPLSLPPTQPVNDIAYLLKKGRIERWMLTTLDLWEGRGRSHDVFYIESVKVPLLTSGSTTINNGRGRAHDLCLRFFKKLWSFTPSDLRSGVRTDLQMSMPTSGSQGVLFVDRVNYGRFLHTFLIKSWLSLEFLFKYHQFRYCSAFMSLWGRIEKSKNSISK